MNIISVRQEPAYRDVAIDYFQRQWASPETMMLYQDSITHCIDAVNPLPQWYLLLDGETVVGCAGLITNDFISRMELYPWLCALYVDEQYRGQGCGALLVNHVAKAAGELGFPVCICVPTMWVITRNWGSALMGLVITRGVSRHGFIRWI